MLSLDNLMAGAFEDKPEQESNARVVIDDQNLLHQHASPQNDRTLRSAGFSTTASGFASDRWNRRCRQSQEFLRLNRAPEKAGAPGQTPGIAPSWMTRQ